MALRNEVSALRHLCNNLCWNIRSISTITNGQILFSPVASNVERQTVTPSLQKVSYFKTCTKPSLAGAVFTISQQRFYAKGVQPKRKKLSFHYSGDLVTQPRLNPDETHAHFKDLAELESAPEVVKRSCSLNFASGEDKKIHRKSYENKREEDLRKEIFLDRVKSIESHNLKYINKETSFYMDINQFSDWTSEEYRQYNRFQMPASGAASHFNRTTFLPPLNFQAPSEVDWRSQGYVTGVKNQEQCGSCWAFSTTGSMEGQHFRLTGSLASLSEQQLVDCSTSYGNQGCNGGNMDNAFLYIRSVGGLESEASYPYTARDDTCTFESSMIVPTTMVQSYQDIARGSESDLRQAVGTLGPVSVAIDASHSSFQSYSGGIYDEPLCSSSQLDHGVLVVGYGGPPGQEYWIVKNSWGAVWGNSGYILMSRDKNNQCGIATMASYPVLSQEL